MPGATYITRRAILTMIPMLLVTTGTRAETLIAAVEPELDVTPTPPAVSAGLADAIAAHRTSSAQFLALCDLTDEIATGRVPTAREMKRLDRALRKDGNLLGALCGYPCESDADEHAKADYLLDLFAASDMPRECSPALLRSMLGADPKPVQKLTPVADTAEPRR
jgi:hypothetical protein